MTTPPPDWDGALCAQTDADLWFPEKGETTVAHAAIRICQHCPLIDTCLDYALTNGERFGVWGGRSERQRRELATRRVAA